jgi:hypothetical protein
MRVEGSSNNRLKISKNCSYLCMYLSLPKHLNFKFHELSPSSLESFTD